MQTSSPETWIQILHDISIITAAAAAAIAAASSLKNGRTLRENREHLTEVVQKVNGKPKKKKTQNGESKGKSGSEWYRAPDL